MKPGSFLQAKQALYLLPPYLQDCTDGELGNSAQGAKAAQEEKEETRCKEQYIHFHGDSQAGGGENGEPIGERSLHKPLLSPFVVPTGSVPCCQSASTGCPCPQGCAIYTGVDKTVGWGNRLGATFGFLPGWLRFSLCSSVFL